MIVLTKKFHFLSASLDAVIVAQENTYYVVVFCSINGDRIFDDFENLFNSTKRVHAPKPNSTVDVEEVIEGEITKNSQVITL